MTVRALAALALLALACTRDAAPRPPIEHRGLGTAPIDAAGLDAGDGACVTACVRDRQMVAMSAEAILAACRLDCQAPPPSP